MPDHTLNDRFELLYWPIAFRGCFVSYLFAYRNVGLIEISDERAIRQELAPGPHEQAVPAMGPPILRDRHTGFRLSQTPAIVLHVAPMLDLLPAEPGQVDRAMKVLLDCGDVLMEICRYNGSIMWGREEWLRFRGQRFPRWLSILEASLEAGFYGNEDSSFADIAVYALLGNMIRCLPQLHADVREHAPGVFKLCQRIGATPSLATHVADQSGRFGTVYCDGQIEASIREMLALDED